MSKAEQMGRAESLITTWVGSVTCSRAKLLAVPLNIRKEMAITVKSVAEGAGVGTTTALTNIHLTQPVIDAMIAENIVVPGHSGIACEWRRRFLNWYECLSNDEKENIPISGGTIKKSEYLAKIPELDGYDYAVINYPLARQTFNEVLEDLGRRGVISNNYMSVKERAAAGALKVKVKTERVNADFEALRSITLSSAADLVNSTPEKPFHSLLHLFSSASMESHSGSGQDNYFVGWTYTCKCLVNHGFSGSEPLEEVLGKYLLLQVRAYLEDLILKDEISTGHGTSIMSSVRISLKTAVQLPGLSFSSFYAAEGFKVRRHTDTYRPYSSSERNRISQAITGDIERIRMLTQPYKLTGVGANPLGVNGELSPGSRTLENARWIFENKLGCEPIGFQCKYSENPYETAFMKIVIQSKLGLEAVYESWGVLNRRDSNVIAPYVARIAQVTGMNVESIASLGVEDFVLKSEIGGRPYLRYWKERSTGEKVAFMDLFHADITWLSVSQAKEVKRIFDDVKSITAGFRAEAPDEVKDKLFIFRSSSGKFFGEIKSLETANKNTIALMLENIVKRHGLKTDLGEPLNLLVTRFRPSLVSELIDNGVPLPQIQLMLGHKHIATTLGYLDKLDFNKVARDKLAQALRNLHSNAMSAAKVDEQAIPVAPVQDPNIIFKTPLAACRDVMNPPDYMKKLKSYNPQKPCQLYNKCISCNNVIITEANLPDLFAMQRDYLRMIELVAAMETPYFNTIRENLSVLSKILDPQFSSFSSEQLENGRRLSEFVETSVLVDGVML